MSPGYTSLDALVAIFTFSILALGVISLAVIGTRLAIDSERRVVALALVNERIEFIRSLPYEHIAYAPTGALVQEEADVQRNQQFYDVQTLVSVVDPGGLQKKVQVTASWRVPAGGSRDVQVVTLVSAASATRSEQVACIPSNGGYTGTAKFNNPKYVDDAFTQCKAICTQPSSLPPWQCCGWRVDHYVQNLADPNSDVRITCECAAPGPLPVGETITIVPHGHYTAFARACFNGTTCGIDGAGNPIVGTPKCDAGCLLEPGNCVCEC